MSKKLNVIACILALCVSMFLFSAEKPIQRDEKETHCLYRANRCLCKVNRCLCKVTCCLLCLCHHTNYAVYLALKPRNTPELSTLEFMHLEATHVYNVAVRSRQASPSAMTMDDVVHAAGNVMAGPRSLAERKNRKLD